MSTTFIFKINYHIQYKYKEAGKTHKNVIHQIPINLHLDIQHIKSINICTTTIISNKNIKTHITYFR